jgi:hypothetical protein
VSGVPPQDPLGVREKKCSKFQKKHMKYFILLTVSAFWFSCNTGDKKVRVKRLWYSNLSTDWVLDNQVGYMYVDTIFRIGDTVTTSDVDVNYIIVP